MSLFRSLAVGTLLASTIGLAAQAAPVTVFDSSPNVPNQLLSIAAATGNTGALAQEFLTETSAGNITLTSVSLDLATLTGGTTGSVVVTLDTVTGGKPNTATATTLGTISDSSLSSTAKFVTLSVSTALTSNTEYFIVLSDACSFGQNCTHTDAAWYNAGAATKGVGLTGQTAYNSTNSPALGNLPFNTVDALPYLATIKVDDSAVVPEPATLAVLGAGLVGLGLARRRARKN